MEKYETQTEEGYQVENTYYQFEGNIEEMVTIGSPSRVTESKLVSEVNN